MQGPVSKGPPPAQRARTGMRPRHGPCRRPPHPQRTPGQRPTAQSHPAHTQLPPPRPCPHQRTAPRQRRAARHLRRPPARRPDGSGGCCMVAAGARPRPRPRQPQRRLQRPWHRLRLLRCAQGPRPPQMRWVKRRPRPHDQQSLTPMPRQAAAARPLGTPRGPLPGRRQQQLHTPAAQPLPGQRPRAAMVWWPRAGLRPRPMPGPGSGMALLAELLRALGHRQHSPWPRRQALPPPPPPPRQHRQPRQRLQHARPPTRSRPPAMAAAARQQLQRRSCRRRLLRPLRRCLRPPCPRCPQAALRRCRQRPRSHSRHWPASVAKEKARRHGQDRAGQTQGREIRAAEGGRAIITSTASSRAWRGPAGETLARSPLAERPQGQGMMGRNARTPPVPRRPAAHARTVPLHHKCNTSPAPLPPHPRERPSPPRAAA